MGLLQTLQASHGTQLGAEKALLYIRRNHSHTLL